MGWLFGWNTRKELAEHLISGNGVKTLKHCFKGNNIWAVQEYTYPDDSLNHERAGKTVQFVALYLIKGCDTYNVKTGRSNRDGWGYKDMDESAGPYYYNCPISYIKMVEAHEKEHGYEPRSYAAEWRAKVREVAEKAKRKLVEGSIISLYGREYKVGGMAGNRRIIWSQEDNRMYGLKRSQMKDVEVLA